MLKLRKRSFVKHSCLRRNFLIIAFLAVLLAFSACDKGDGSPSNVVKQFWAALEKKDEAAVAKLLSEPEIAPAFFRMVTVFGDVKHFDKTIAKNAFTIVNMEETINGDTAVVKAAFKDGTTSNFELIKLDGKWKLK
ncbi:MAG: DUF4878 domain-containing protein [Leptospirales bacterium]|nr:DUF4878 domain-containing protein [Leptospirales bacterium]